ncbi:MAG TPA: FAD-dependent monooxygenase [Bryobacteraceae bacterium]|nr:FAD-dependent monooxygenase [Bryobacteraceae bacterium]
MTFIPDHTDLFVIGGGPAGLAAAIAARRRGFRVTVADCSAPPIDKACGEGIMPDGIAAARAIGIDLERAGGMPFRGIRFREGKVSVEAAFPHGHGLGLRRTTLHAMMAQQAKAAGVRLMWDVRVTGLCGDGALLDGRKVRARWIAGADGGRSLVRRWAGLEAFRRDRRRYGFRRHYRVAAPNDFMEIHWGRDCQLYITPVSPGEVCVALISDDSHLRLEAALPQFPEVARWVADGPSSVERGGVSASRRLKSVYRGNVALVGDASGSVDAITGEGLCTLFQQAEALAGALAAGDLRRYQAAHTRIGRRPEMMARLMVSMGAFGGLRRRAMEAMRRQPRLFAGMLALHMGERSPLQSAPDGLALGWRMLTL